MLYRESPLNSIWEGSGNVICLDVLRTIARDPECFAALQAELDLTQHSGYAAALAAHRARWAAGVPEAEARWFAESAASLLAASVLLRFGDGPVPEAYVRTRLGAERGRTYGALGGLDSGAILAAWD
jgi:putative acyl-CoA dehydrogenase